MKRRVLDEKKRTEAQERAEARAKRSNAQQVALLDNRPGESRRERARLSGGA